jgi:hypothetical protein
MLKLVSDQTSISSSEIVRARLNGRLLALRLKLLEWFFTAFPMKPWPLPPEPNPPLAKAAVLREGAKLHEDVDAIAS